MKYQLSSPREHVAGIDEIAVRCRMWVGLIGMVSACLIALQGSEVLAGAQDIHPFYDVSPTLRNLGCRDGLTVLGVDGRRLSSAQSALYWKRKQAAETRNFIHVGEGRAADLNHPFLSVFDESSNFFLGKMVPETSDPYEAYFSPSFMGTGPDVHSTESVGRFWRMERLGFMVLRGRGQNPYSEETQFTVQNAFPEGRRGETIVALTERDHAEEHAQMAQDSLYGRYSNQGKGRSDEITHFLSQDAETSHRTTRFVIHLNGQIIAHIQAQHSFDVSDPLNLETKFGKVERKAGELTIELGRLLVAKDDELSPETKKMMASFGGRDFLRTLLYQRVFSWINADAKSGRVVMQMNDKGLSHFLDSGKRGFGQWQFDEGGKVVLDTPEQKEWVLSIGGANLLKTEDEEMQSLLSQALARGKKQVGSMGPGFGLRPNLLYVFLRENEFPVVSRLMAKGKFPNIKSMVEFPNDRPAVFESQNVPSFGPRNKILFLSIE